MPNPTITGSSYAGEFAGKYLAASLFSADARGIVILPITKALYRKLIAFM